MSGADSLAAALFYASLALVVGGAIFAARASIERRQTDRRALGLAGLGCIGVCASVAVYVAGPHRMLPF